MQVVTKARLLIIILIVTGFAMIIRICFVSRCRTHSSNKKEVDIKQNNENVIHTLNYYNVKEDASEENSLPVYSFRGGKCWRMEGCYTVNF